MNSIKEKAPGLLSLFGLIASLSIWYVYLFMHQPEGTVIEGALEQLSYSFDTNIDGNIYFYLQAITTFLLIIYSALFLFTKKHKTAMSLVIINTIISASILAWPLALNNALPLLYAKNVFKNS